MSEITVTCSALSDIGRSRAQNQDAWFAKPEVGVYGVSDGMGGHAAGQLAAQIVAETLPGLLRKHLHGTGDLRSEESKDVIANALAELSAAVLQEGQTNDTLLGMGTTVVAAIIRKKTAAIAHVGDSRAYLYRDDALRQLTQDHTLAETLVRAGAINSEEAADHPGRSQLTRFIGMDGPPHPDVQCVELRDRDQLLLCSDGLFGLLDDTRLCEIISQSNDPPTTCRNMIDAANQAGGHDNITALLLSIESS